MRSVLDQGYPATEYLVLDGGSTDGSRGIIEAYADQLAYWRSNPDDGQAAAVNEGWNRSTGQILGWLNSDDFYAPGALERVAQWFAANPQAAAVYGICNLVDRNGRPIGRQGAPFQPRRFGFTLQTVPQPSVFMRRSAWEEAGALDVALRYAMDYDLFLRVFRRHPPGYIPRALAAATVHPMAKTTLDRAVAKREGLRIAARYASPPGRVVIAILDFGARCYHAMPRLVRRQLDRLRHHPTLYA
jgi:glycosyltransferase involved in cell wall biosynthesis